MTNSLPLFHRVAGQPVIVLGEGEAGEAKRRLVERFGAVIVGEDNGEARLAFVALAEPEAVAARLKARGLLVNVTDRPDLCDFTVPSLLERGPVQIAVGTGGVSAGLAKALRLRLETMLPASLGALAEGLGRARGALRARFADGAERRRALDAALAAGGILDPLDAASAARVDAWLAGAAAGTAGLAEIVLRSADPDDLTLREARLLGSADLVVHDAAVPVEILLRARADASRREIGDGGADATFPGLTVVLRAPR
ncbi:bifunctional precorrin-2 dehydrogenase/sirohydrochlorin ferrochelatase [Novosphingobium sp. TH158]|uniref:precorrin-2 dehydrogenase/sirohydrochlorin ferrochelatase family protein n=1 Tax=Novosphingobium sp. TH158 TaxID=2067455 RepID=UPI000C7DAE85|nr:NAD(P)-dependent oxidoreductase [Novosphingobium sp. TH158]PLK26594.1 siroheme synthase [Novosphingobium sp. TH158]